MNLELIDVILRAELQFVMLGPCRGLYASQQVLHVSDTGLDWGTCNEEDGGFWCNTLEDLVGRRGWAGIVVDFVKD